MAMALAPTAEKCSGYEAAGAAENEDLVSRKAMKLNV